MNWQNFLTSEMVVDLGWTLLHSLWQIGLVAIVLQLSLRLLRDAAANLRYAVALGALGIASLLPVVTFIQISRPAAMDTESATVAGSASPKSEFRPDVDRERTKNVLDARSESGIAAPEGSSLDGVRAYIDREISQFLPIAVGLWMIGVALFSIRLGGGLCQLRRYRYEGVEPAVGESLAAFRELCDRLKMRQNVELVRSTLVQTPIAIGVLKPMILVPASLLFQISPRELETIVAHELVHIRQYDPIVNILQCVAEVVFFYHPAMWWMSAIVRREREFAADAAVMNIYTDSHMTYARALANLEEIRLTAKLQTPRYATAANGGNLMLRMQKILKVKTEVSGTSSAWTAGLALLLTSAVVLGLFLSNSSAVVNAQKAAAGRKLAIGFVSIPPVDRTENAPKDADATARLLIEKLKRYKVPATGFLQGGMISDGEKFHPVRANIARLWIDAGFEVGLGGFKHIRLHNTPVDEYIANIEKNERVAKKLIGNLGLPPRYFSYPFLNTGKTTEDKAKVESWLASRGYTSVKYTMDNSEWMYSYAYDMARNDNDVNTMKEVREAYLVYMDKMFDHYEAYSAEMFGRDIAQTLVLTPSRLITDTADEFFSMATKRGYSFVSVDEAQGDQAYKTTENFTGEAGISWFERWSLAKKRPLRDEPRVDSSIEKVWNGRQAKK